MQAQYRELAANSTRRTFLQTAAALAAASSLPRWFVEECRAQPGPQPAQPGQEFGIALVGCGGMGRGDAKNASRFGRVVALCDVDEKQLATAAESWPEASRFQDFRQVMDRPDVDVVICGTVDHWHTLVSLAAMRAGKDVYCEKPLTLTIDEGKRLVKMQQETGRVLQTGSQQRSDANFRLACELVRNGRLGKLEEVQVWLPAGRREGPFAKAPVPAGLNWDMWQGQTSAVDYVPERTHLTFRYWWEYSGGTMTDWGAHHNDIALWGLGRERSGPVRIEARSLAEMIPEGFSACSEYEVHYTYADGVVHRCRSTIASAWNGAVVDPNGQLHGVKFVGKDGWIWVTRGQIEASHPDLLEQPLAASSIRLPVSSDHMGNFFEAVKSRQPAICDVEIGHRSATVCHLGVIAMRLRQPLQWDPDSEQLIDNEEANSWLARPQREPWTYEMVA